MSNKIKNYLDVLFIDIPRSQKAVELKEELLSNMNERFDDYIREGKSEVQSYTLVVASMGDIDELLHEVMPDADFKIKDAFYRTRNAKNMGIGLSLYIIGAAILVALATQSNDLTILGFVILLIFIAIATGLILYTKISTPTEHRYFSKKSYREKTSRGRVFQTILTIFGAITLLVYFAISFTTKSWHISWVIWPIAAILIGIVETIYDMRDAE